MSEKEAQNAPPPYQQYTGGQGYGAPPMPPGGYMQAPPPQYGAPQQPYPQYQTGMNTNVIVADTHMGMPGYQAAPVDYTTQAWIACLCCFWPTGLLAIMKANESRDALARGDIAGAQMAANSARTMVRISWIAGIISVVVAMVIIGVYLGVIFSTINSYDD